MSIDRSKLPEEEAAYLDNLESNTGPHSPGAQLFQRGGSHLARLRGTAQMRGKILIFSHCKHTELTVSPIGNAKPHGEREPPWRTRQRVFLKAD
jgi:hypothetical protein